MVIFWFKVQKIRENTIHIDVPRDNSTDIFAQMYDYLMPNGTVGRKILIC